MNAEEDNIIFLLIVRLKSTIAQQNKISRMRHRFAGILNTGQTRKATGTFIMPPFNWKMWLIV